MAGQGADPEGPRQRRSPTERPRSSMARHGTSRQERDVIAAVKKEKEQARASADEVMRPSAELYTELSAPFDETFRDIRGGVELTYITGEQAIRRLNEVLGADGWSFKILEHGIHAE